MKNKFSRTFVRFIEKSFRFVVSYGFLLAVFVLFKGEKN